MGTKVAFTLGQNTPRKMVVLLVKKTFFIFQIAKSTAYYAAQYTLCERAFRSYYFKNMTSAQCHNEILALK